jgi:hypothetical protein
VVVWRPLLGTRELFAVRSVPRHGRTFDAII